MNRIRQWGIRHPHLRHSLRPLDQAGVVLGVVAFALSQTPSLLPRSSELQGRISGFAVAAAYVTGVALTWLARRIGLRPLAPRVRRRLWYAIGGVALVSIPLAVWLGATWQEEVRHAAGMPPRGSYDYFGMLVVAWGVTTVLIALTRLLQEVHLALAHGLTVFIAPRAARFPAAVLVAAVCAGMTYAAVYHGLIRSQNASYAAYDAGTDTGVRRPTSPLRSGSAASRVSWDQLGRAGRGFVASGPTVGDIERLTGRPAVAPIRVYAGTLSSGSLRGEAELVLTELKRTGAFDRALLAVGTPTGQGGLEAAISAPLEYMYGGSTAIAGMQYSVLPSWISFLVEQDRAQQCGRVLFNTIYAYWSTLPPAHRPRLVVFGQSLGALGAAGAFSDVTDATSRTSAALFVGPPSRTDIWRRAATERAPGSPERLPVYGDGRTVVFADSVARLHAPGGSLLSPRVVFLQHASDPIVWWSPDVMWREPAWLSEPHGPDVVGTMQWVPLVTFLQVTGDLNVGLDPPAGHGHHYGPEVVAAWAALLHAPHWTDAQTAALSARTR